MLDKQLCNRWMMEKYQQYLANAFCVEGRLLGCVCAASLCAASIQIAVTHFAQILYAMRDPKLFRKYQLSIFPFLYKSHFILNWLAHTKHYHIIDTKF